VPRVLHFSAIFYLHFFAVRNLRLVGSNSALTSFSRGADFFLFHSKQLLNGCRKKRSISLNRLRDALPRNLILIREYRDIFIDKCVIISLSEGHTDRDGMREGSGNVADVVSAFDIYFSAKIYFLVYLEGRAHNEFFESAFRPRVPRAGASRD